MQLVYTEMTNRPLSVSLKMNLSLMKKFIIDTSKHNYYLITCFFMCLVSFSHLKIPFCHLGEGHHFTGFPPVYLFLFPELVGEPKLLIGDDDPPPTCLRGALAPTAVKKQHNYIRGE